MLTAINLLYLLNDLHRGFFFVFHPMLLAVVNKGKRGGILHASFSLLVVFCLFIGCKVSDTCKIETFIGQIHHSKNAIYKKCACKFTPSMVLCFSDANVLNFQLHRATLCPPAWSHTLKTVLIRDKMITCGETHFLNVYKVIIATWDVWIWHTTRSTQD